MKLNRYFSLVAAGLAFIACSDMDEIAPKSGTMLASQVQETNVIAPSRGEASFNGLFVSIGEPYKVYGTSYRADDWQFLMLNYSNDVEGADLIIPDSGYNWFSVCGEYTSRNANYANPYIRYAAPYNLIGSVNTFISGYSEDVSDAHSLNMIAQAKCLRSWAYAYLAEAFQFNYQIAKDKPCVPLVTPETTDFAHNPRVSVAEIYDYMLQDLNEAIEVLDNSTETRATKMYIDKHVAHGLRARLYLNMGEWQKAYDDAVAAADGFKPATLEQVSKPYFYDISEPCWIWGYDMTTDLANGAYATTTSWLRSFSGNSYSAACAVYAEINSLLWTKIPDTDIRKQWWVDEDLKSTLLDGLTWDGQGDIANLVISDVKEAFLPYTNVKFGVNKIGTTTNDEDTPLMRVEEMILIQAEAQAHIDASKATQILTDWIKEYRDPQYNVNGRGLSLLDEIWFQRRVELWGEGFGIRDIKRLNKPLVRFHDNKNNEPDAFRFNMAADDGWLLMRFPQDETNTNYSIEDNTDGSLPVMDQNPELRDGVTD